MRYKRGWYGNSQGHALAARGIRLYAKKEKGLVDPLFYAQKPEQQVSFVNVMDMVRNGKDLRQMELMHPDVDREELRKQGIQAVESYEGDNILSMMDRQGVDTSVHMATYDARLKRRMEKVLEDRQKSSLLPQQKVELLRRRLHEI